MAIEIEKIVNMMITLGFTKSELSNLFSKAFDSLDYTISIDLDKEKIDYGSKIKLGDKTTSNFENPENFVVLECVNRLLEKGYRPEDLELERRYKLGRTKKSGKADITVKGKNKKALIIIECKTFGYEFEVEIDKMRRDGGQLFSYFQQDKGAKFLCLYTSQVLNDSVDYKYKMVYTEDSKEEINQQSTTDQLITYTKATQVSELVEVWKYKIETNNINEFEEEGIFEDHYLAYQPGVGPLKKSSLKELVFSRNDANNIYRQFEEALRHHNISDRSNAFNRVISLILAKIVDEEKNEDEVLDFQIKPVADTPEELYDRLAGLYKRAMDKYLKEKYTFYSAKELEDIIISFPKQTAKNEIRRILKETKYYSNNEFAFKEIYNKELFEQNFQVLKEIIQLIQPFRFKYNRKAQFLGDFFENLLEEGFKQTEGQYFTPTPLAKFIVSSLPLKEHILNKISDDDNAFLPKIIDYACGSGHFLTESIEEIQQIIEELPASDDENIDVTLTEFKQSTRWAKDFIFGIEKDYRLARTSQVACFMHGDGDANIIFGDGLELWNNVKGKKSYFDEETFDFLVANPPYSIKDFTKHLNENRLADFELLKNIKESGSNPDDIEVLFLERIKQLLKVGGIAGVFFPRSILSSTGLYTKAREILIKHFEIKAIFEPSSNAFAKTGTNTIVLFIKRRYPNFAIDCRYIAEDLIFNNKTRENDFVDSSTLLNDYINYLKIPIDDYKSIISKNANDSIVQTEFYENYKKTFDKSALYKDELKKASFKKLSKEEKKLKLTSLFYDFILSAETEKFEYFLLTHRKVIENEQIKFIPQQLVIVKTGNDNNSQRTFLGYKWSDSKSGAGKGIQYNLDENNLHSTKLYEVKRITKEYNGKIETFEKTEKNNPNKANYYVFNALLDKPINDISTDLTENIIPAFLYDTFDFDFVNFEKRIKISFVKPIEFNQNYPLGKIENVCELISGQSPLSKFYNEVGNGKPFYQGRTEFGEKILNLPKVWTTQVTKLSIKNDILISVRAPVGDVNMNPFDEICLGRGLSAIRVNEQVINRMYLFNLLYYYSELVVGDLKASFEQITREQLLSIKIPLPPLDIQQKIVDEIAVLEEREKEGREKIEVKKGEIEIIIDMIYSNNYYLAKIEDICQVVNGATPKTTNHEYWNGSICWATMVDTKAKYLYDTERKITENGLNSCSTKLLPINTVVFSSKATIGDISITKIETCTNQDFKSLICNDEKLYYEYLYYILKREVKNIILQSTGLLKEITTDVIKNYKIPLPSIEEQNEIVEKILEIEKEIEETENSIAELANEKKAILKRYLE